MRNSKLVGVLTSYVYMGVCIIYNLLLTPILIREFGQLEYGNYQYYYAIFASLNAFDFGFGTMATRYMALLAADEKKEKWENFIHAVFVLAMTVGILMFIIGMLIYAVFFQRSSQYDDLILMVAFMSLCSAIKFILIFYYGTLNGQEKFGVSNGIQIFQTMGKIALIIVLASTNQLSFVKLTLAELVTLIAALVLGIIYIKRESHLRLIRCSIDKYCLLHSLDESKNYLVSSISIYMNGKLIIVIIGNLLNKLYVTIYSISYSITSNFESLSAAVSSIYLPEATKLIHKKTARKELEDFCIRPGRVQFMICTMILGGFAILGKDFLQLWLGYYDSKIYFTCIVMMAGGIPPILMSVGARLVMAEGTHIRIYSLGTLAFAVANLLITSVAIKLFGYIGVPITFFLTNFIIHGIYFPFCLYKTFNIRYMRVYKETIRGILLCSVLASVAAYLCGRALRKISFFNFCIKGFIFVAVYIVIIFIYGLNREEKEKVIGIMKRKGNDYERKE